LAMFDCHYCVQWFTDAVVIDVVVIDVPVR